MIRALALATLLSACTFDATLGVRTSQANQPDAAPQAPFDAGVQIDLPPHLAFDFANADGPLLYDSAGFTYAIQSGSLVRVDMSTMFRDYVTEQVTAMAQDATTIYALQQGNLVAISKFPTYPPANGPIDAANPVFSVTTIATGLLGSTAIAVDDTGVFITLGSSLVRLDKSGANQSVLFTSTSLSAVAVDASFAYVVEHVASGRLLAIPKTGGTALVLASALVDPFALDLAAGYVYVTEQGIGIADGAIGRTAAPAAGATSAAVYTRIVTGAQRPVDLTHDDTYLYWTADRDGLLRVPLAGGSAELRFGTTATGNTAIAIQADHVLFVAPDDTGGHEVHAVQR